jgi:type I restriction enzyme M protein
MPKTPIKQRGEHMSSVDVAALIVPQGKVVDFIDSSFRQETPEEYVRQEIEKSLVREYKYSRDEISVEFRIKIGSSKRAVDLAIFPEGATRQQEHIWAIVECKAVDVTANDKDDGIGQLKSYLAACLNAEFGMWTNGQGGERLCFRKIHEGGKVTFIEINDIPTKGKTLDDAERPTFEALRPATSDALLFAFQRCHNYIAGNAGLQKPEAFWELLKLIFCKIADERSDEISFYATTTERQSMNGQGKIKKRVDAIFSTVRDSYQTIFKPNEIIDLPLPVLAYLISQLQSFYLLDSDVDVKGKAYEEIVGSNVRGDRGEFFTPRNICRMAVLMLDPGPSNLILDPACGTGGFLTVAMNHVIGKIRENESKKWKYKDKPTDGQRRALDQRIAEYANKRIVGIDINPNLVRAAKMNIVMNNDGSGGLYQGNSLAKPVTWGQDLRARNLMGCIDFLFTNPPFGSKITIDEPTILEQFDAAKQWDYDKQGDTFSIRQPVTFQKRMPPEQLFVERCVQFLKPGTGRMAIVVPDGILGSPGLAYIREWILQQTQVLASIDLHPDTFQPKNSTQTSLLILQRKRFDEIEIENAARKKKDYDVFMALANHVGHDKRGNTTYQRDKNGDILIEKRKETQREERDGKVIYKTIEIKQKLVDDNTADIAEAFRGWLAEQT